MPPSAIDTKAFGLRFRQALQRKGYGGVGATDLANALLTEFPAGLSIQSVHKWINGTAVPRPERLAVLADWLDVSEHWLHHGPDPHASKRPNAGAERPLSAKDLSRRLQALSEGQRSIVEALLAEFEKLPRE